MKSLLSLYKALFADCKRLHPEARGLDRDLLTIEARVEHEGVSFLAITLPALCKIFDQGLADGRLGRTPGFSGSGSIPKFLSGMISLVFDSKSGLLVHDCDVSVVKTIRQILLMCKKLLPESESVTSLDSKTQKQFCDVNASVVEPPIGGRLQERLQHVLPMVLRGLDDLSELEGKHGPGAVVEGFTPNQKWLSVYHGLSEFDHRLMVTGYDLPAMLMCRTSSPALDPVSLGTSAKLQCVPKSYSKLRTITVEPCLSQFSQQALGEHLRRNIRKCSILRNSIALDRQELNQKLALEGSRSGNWCTIDLSNASDLLSHTLVKQVLERFPRFMRGIAACRTPDVETIHGPVTLKMYAGMGNATTFPMQSVVFALLAICASVRQDLPDEREVVRASKNVRVYGDDIIVRTNVFSQVSCWLSSFGLKINQAKTFSTGYFRESCGWDAYRGQLVTPVYLKHLPSVTSKEPKAYVSNVACSNQLWMECYYETSDYLRAQVDKGFPLPLVSRRGQALGWYTRLDVVAFSKWNRNLHRFEVKSYVPTPIRREDRLDGVPALLKFFHSNHHEFDVLDEEHLESSPRKYRIKLAKRWVQAA